MKDLDKIEKFGYDLDSIMKSRTEREDMHFNIQRDELGIFIESKLEGWYQDPKGSLYHYDGVIWDKVPDWDIKQLEYLG